jgi:hypothetical protein
VPAGGALVDRGEELELDEIRTAQDGDDEVAEDATA